MTNTGIEQENTVPKLTTRSGSSEHKVVSKDQWVTARKALLEEEKALFRLHDKLKEKRRALPWVKVDKEYVFEGTAGRQSLADLFDGKHQLIVYHFMFGPDWEAGCPHCSFWADHYDGAGWHLGQRDTSFVAISRAPLNRIEAFRKRMGWKFRWLSSGGNDFNFDFDASFRPEEIKAGKAVFNYARVDPAMTRMTDREGASTFYKDDQGAVYHTYSTWARGIDLLNTTYNLLDLTAKGRDEDPDSPQSWVKHHDKYGAA